MESNSQESKVLNNIGQPGTLSSRYARGSGKGPTTRVYCMEPYLSFLQEAVPKARTRDHKVLNNMNKAIWYFMILAVLLNTTAAAGSYLNLVLDKAKLVLRDEVENELLPWLYRSMVTLTIKYLNFCIAKLLQFRYLAPLQTAPSTIMSLLFWVALTHSVSSLDS